MAKQRSLSHDDFHFLGLFYLRGGRIKVYYPIVPRGTIVYCKVIEFGVFCGHLVHSQVRGWRDVP